jgi:hypothetical protein
LVALLAGACLALAALSLLAPSAPTYDPWAWLVWGRQVAELRLDTVNGPSWKPLPVLVTTPLALAGDAAPALWLVVARAGALAAVALAFVLARRLAGPAAGLAAAAGLAVAPWFVRNAWLGNSEGLLVALALGAALAHAQRRRALAFALGAGVGLLRPEAWPFVGLYALWLAREDRRRLPWLALGLVGLGLLWLGPEEWGSGRALRSSERAERPLSYSPAFADRPLLAVLDNAAEMLPVAALAGLALAALLVLVRRAPPGAAGLALGVGTAGLAWAVLVGVMSEAGFSGNTRYLVLPAAAGLVVGAAGLAWVLAAVLPARLRRAGPVRALGAVLLAAAFTAASLAALPGVARRAEQQSRLVPELAGAVASAGGPARLRACGRVVTSRFFVPAVAWRLGLPLREVGHVPGRSGVVLQLFLESRPRHWSPPLRRPAGRLAAERGSWRVWMACGADADADAGAGVGAGARRR